MHLLVNCCDIKLMKHFKMCCYRKIIHVSNSNNALCPTTPYHPVFDCFPKNNTSCSIFLLTSYLCTYLYSVTSNNPKCPSVKHRETQWVILDRVNCCTKEQLKKCSLSSQPSSKWYMGIGNNTGCDKCPPALNILVAAPIMNELITWVY